MTAPNIADDSSDIGTLQALLTLAASGLAAEVIDGTARERAAVQMGQQLGRASGTVLLACQGRDAAYSWPDDWQRAVGDYARAAASGATVSARRQNGRGVPA